MKPHVFGSVEDFKTAEQQAVGTSDWLRVEQSRIDSFAETTEDHQWIHVDPERSAQGPFGATVAHGLLTLSLIVPMMKQCYEVENHRMGVNYGFDRVRFPSPVPTGSDVRISLFLEKLTEVADGVQVHWRATVERKGSDRPCCVAEPIFRYFF